MCIGDRGTDTLRDEEANFLRNAAGRDFPTHDFQLHRNDDAMLWVVLEPERTTARTPRFTICRIDPCVLVMVEDRASARRFRSVASVEQAVRFALETTRRGASAVMNVHDTPHLVQ